MATNTTAKAKPEEKLVTLTNKQRRMIPYNLAGEHMRSHKTYGYRRVSQTRTTHNRRTGVLGSINGRASVPTSITFCARETKQNLPKAIIRCPEVDAAIKRGDLKVTYQNGPVGDPVESAPRKTTLQLQTEREEATEKAEAAHKKTDLYKNAIATHKGKPTLKKSEPKSEPKLKPPAPPSD